MGARKGGAGGGGRPRRQPHFCGGDTWRMQQLCPIMLRYRPIAPKPMINTPGSETSTPKTSESSIGRRRRKRRHVGKYFPGDTRSSRRRKSSVQDETESRKALTLPLFPESHEGFGSPEAADLTKTEINLAMPMTSRAERVTWITVESVKDTWVDPEGSGCTDLEKLMILEADTCPGFVTDGSYRVQWANKRYGEMVAVADSGGEVAARLAVKEGVKLPTSCSGFTCSARLVTCRKVCSSMVVPCDVWKMDVGGFAWRLDTKAALSLGALPL